MNTNFDGNFEEIEVTDDTGAVMVSLEYIGEGWDGDYDADDSEDSPLLRYSVYCKYQEGASYGDFVEGDAYQDGEWMACTNSSYCTRLCATDDRDKLIEAAKRILAHVSQGVIGQAKQKRLYEYLSWIQVYDDGTIGDQYGKVI